ncbi:MAG: histidine ammonia-lyase [Streptosporangiales bacterium]|nr:histidine ammonia-lyase [Streptosporangiales bacterium]
MLLDGRSLRCADVEHIAWQQATVDVDPQARQRVADARAAVLDVADRRPVYGLSTGVGANRAVAVDDDEMGGHGMRLLRSHAACTGPTEDDTVVRATLAIRLNQVLAGGSGIRPQVVDALSAALTADALPSLHRYGSLGTGDLSPLAELGLTLAGELPSRTGGVPPIRFAAGEALAFMSSSAVTLATATLASGAAARMIEASQVVAALSFLALEGSDEAYAAAVHGARPHPGAVRVAGQLRRLLGATRPASRIQDPFALRAIPQVNGAAVEALDRVRDVIDVEINAAVENPLVVPGTGDVPADVYHHGQFHATETASALDAARPALASACALSTGRLSALLEPDLTGLSVFLATGPAGSSGLLVLEYVAHDVLAEIQHAAAPVTTRTAVISRGLEDHASFATQGARLTAQLAEQMPIVLGCELVAAVRALRAAPERLTDAPAREAFEAADTALPADGSDRPHQEDIAAAVTLLPHLPDLVAGHS